MILTFGVNIYRFLDLYIAKKNMVSDNLSILHASHKTALLLCKALYTPRLPQNSSKLCKASTLHACHKTALLLCKAPYTPRLPQNSSKLCKALYTPRLPQNSPQLCKALYTPRSHNTAPLLCKALYTPRLFLGVFATLAKLQVCKEIFNRRPSWQEAAEFRATRKENCCSRNF